MCLVHTYNKIKTAGIIGKCLLDQFLEFSGLNYSGWLNLLFTECLSFFRLYHMWWTWKLNSGTDGQKLNNMEERMYGWGYFSGYCLTWGLVNQIYWKKGWNVEIKLLKLGQHQGIFLSENKLNSGTDGQILNNMEERMCLRGYQYKAHL